MRHKNGVYGVFLIWRHIGEYDVLRSRQAYFCALLGHNLA